MITLPCLGGTNRSLTTQYGSKRYHPFIRNDEGQSVQPFEIETYFLDRHPDLGEYWRHESLVTSDAVAAAYAEYIVWRRKRDEERALTIFSAAAADRAFRERIDPMNLHSASALLPVMLGETRSNQWREMDSPGWHYALRQLNGWPQLDRRNRLKRADTVAIEGTKLVAWFDWRGFKSDEHASQVDYAILIMFTKPRVAFWWGNEHALLDLLEQPRVPTG